MDECISAWKGSDGEYVAEGMPHKTKIAHKPEGVGVEMKALACGETGIILKLDIGSKLKEEFLTGIWGGNGCDTSIDKRVLWHWKSSVYILRQVNGQNLENAQCVFSKNGKTD